MTKKMSYQSIGQLVYQIQFINKVISFISFGDYTLILTSYISPKTQNIGKSFVRMSNIDFFHL